jgi:hypothetical protein
MPRFHRARELALALALALARAAAAAPDRAPDSAFVRANGTQFELNGPFFCAGCAAACTS